MKIVLQLLLYATSFVLSIYLIDTFAFAKSFEYLSPVGKILVLGLIGLPHSLLLIPNVIFKTERGTRKQIYFILCLSGLIWLGICLIYCLIYVI